MYQVIYTQSPGHIHPHPWGWMLSGSRVNGTIISGIYERKIDLYLFTYNLVIVSNILHIPYPNLPHMFFPWTNPLHAVVLTHFTVSLPYRISYTLSCVQITINSGSSIAYCRTQNMYLPLSLQRQRLQTSPAKNDCN